MNAVVDTPEVVTGDRRAAVEDEDAFNDVNPDTTIKTRPYPVDVREELPRDRDSGGHAMARPPGCSTDLLEWTSADS